jgi:hypothetical protein
MIPDRSDTILRVRGLNLKQNYGMTVTKIRGTGLGAMNMGDVDV